MIWDILGLVVLVLVIYLFATLLNAEKL
ncbi:potassium-transporting ATPase subunit F [Leptospirillum ferrooxidans]